MQGHQADAVLLGVLFVFHDQGDVVEETGEGFEVGQSADEFLEVFQPAGGFGGFVLAPHLGVAGLVEHDLERGDVAVAGEAGAPLGEVGEEFAQVVAQLALDCAFGDQGFGGGVKRDLAVAGGFVELAQGGGADAAAGEVDDALEGQVVGGLVQEAGVGDGVADFLALVEAQAADDAVGDAEGDQAFLDRAGLSAGAEEDGHLGERVAAAAQGFHAVADHAGFLVGVPEADDFDFFAGGVVGAAAQGFAEAGFVVGDQGRCRRQDLFGGAVVAFEADDLGAGEVAFEAEDVFDFGAAPGVDRLIFVADAADVVVALGEEAEPEVLDGVGVLVFVDQDVAEAAVVVGQDFGVVAQDFGHVHQQVAEIGGVHGAQAVLVVGVEAAGGAAGEVGVLGGGDAGGGEAAVLPALDDAHQGRRGPALDVDAGGLHHLFQEAELVVSVQDVEAAGQADEFGVAAQHAGAQRVEGAEPEALGGAADDGGDAFAHFAGGAVGEGDGEDLAGEGAAAEQDVGEAGGQHTGLAGAGAGQDEDGAVQRLDSLALFGVQAGEIVDGRFLHGAGIERGTREGKQGEGSAVAARSRATGPAGA